MGIEIIHDNPLCAGGRLAGHQLVDQLHKIGLCPACATLPNHFTGRDIPPGQQRLGAMPLIIVFALFVIPWLHGLRRGLSLQGLDAGLLIHASGRITPVSQSRGLLIDLTNVANLFLFALIRFPIEPIPTLMRA